MFFRKFISIRNEKKKKKMNKPAYLGLSPLLIGKTLMYHLWYGYIKPKYQRNAKIYYIDTVNFIKTNKIITIFWANTFIYIFLRYGDDIFALFVSPESAYSFCEYVSSRH